MSDHAWRWGGGVTEYKAEMQFLSTHKVHAKGCVLVVKQLFEFCNFAAKHLGSESKATDHTKAACIGHGSSKLVMRHTIHASEDDGELDAQSKK
jgi:hypothetical protein